jgi:hypothetical protein
MTLLFILIVNQGMIPNTLHMTQYDNNDFALKILRYHLYEKNLLDLYWSQKFLV